MISDKIVELRRTIEEYTCLHIPPVILWVQNTSPTYPHGGMSFWWNNITEAM
jgi:hypothetical protein